MNYESIGKYIHEVDVRNNSQDCDNLLGVSTSKRFIKSVANTVGTDFSKYKIVLKNQFAYVPDTSRRGDKIAIALFKGEKAIISSAYTVFEITDEEKLLPDYLMLWFNREEFDRYARFKSHGSVREIFDWDSLCETEIKIPPVEEQRRLINSYENLKKKVTNIDKSIDVLQNLCLSIFNDLSSDESNIFHNVEYQNCPLSTIMNFKNGYAFKSSSYVEHGNYNIVTIKNVQDGYFDNKTFEHIEKLPKNIQQHQILKDGDILLSLTGNVGRTCFCYGNNNLLNQRVALFDTDYKYWCYTLFLSKDFTRLLINESGGTAQQNLSTLDILKISVDIPDKDTLSHFEKVVEPLYKKIINLYKEKSVLERIVDKYFFKILYEL